MASSEIKKRLNAGADGSDFNPKRIKTNDAPFRARGQGGGFRGERGRSRGDGRVFTPRGGRGFSARDGRGRDSFNSRGSGDLSPQGGRGFRTRGGRGFGSRGRGDFSPRGVRGFNTRGGRGFGRGRGEFSPRGGRGFNTRGGQVFGSRGRGEFSPRGGRGFNTRGGRGFGSRGRGDFSPRGGRGPGFGRTMGGSGGEETRETNLTSSQENDDSSVNVLETPQESAFGSEMDKESLAANGQKNLEGSVMPCKTAKGTKHIHENKRGLAHQNKGPLKSEEYSDSEDFPGYPGWSRLSLLRLVSKISNDPGSNFADSENYRFSRFSSTNVSKFVSREEFRSVWQRLTEQIKLTMSDALEVVKVNFIRKIRRGYKSTKVYTNSLTPFKLYAENKNLKVTDEEGQNKLLKEWYSLPKDVQREWIFALEVVQRRIDVKQFNYYRHHPEDIGEKKKKNKEEKQLPNEVS